MQREMSRGRAHAAPGWRAGAGVGSSGTALVRRLWDSKPRPLVPRPGPRHGAAVSVHRSLLALRVSLLALVSCGGRTDLLIPEGADIAGASADVASADGSPPIDAGDTHTGDTDALPPIDVAQPRDVVNECPNAAATLVYVITTAGNL